MVVRNTVADSNRGDQLASCASPASRASDCPTGRNIDLRFQVTFNNFPGMVKRDVDDKENHFQGCSFPSREMHYKCLGSWKAADGQNYLALMDTELPQLGEEIRPRYRCGVSPCLSSYPSPLLRSSVSSCLDNHHSTLFLCHSFSSSLNALTRAHFLVLFYRRCSSPSFECPRLVACWRHTMNDEQ